MNKFILHSNILSLTLELREIYSNLRLNDCEDLLDKLSDILIQNMGLNRSQFSINIPAFDYTPFNNPNISVSQNNTSFALARRIFKFLSRDKFDIYWDPVFSLISYPGTGKTLNHNENNYFPFVSGSTILNKNSFLIFTKDAFQLSNIMQAEIEYFNDKHPYRRSKKFIFNNLDLNKKIEFNYWVRPRNELANYDLNNLYNLLIKNEIAKPLEPSSIYYLSYESLFNFISTNLANDPFFLLSLDSKLKIVESFVDKKVPNYLFL